MSHKMAAHRRFQRHLGLLLAALGASWAGLGRSLPVRGSLVGAKMAREVRIWGDHVGGVINRGGGVIKISRGVETTPPDVDARPSFTNAK